jgi:predicted helicase
MAAFPDFIASLDADPLRRGKQFEVFVKWFLQHDPEWATQVDQVWLWHEYPGRWGVDCGIDLVFRHKSGETWAVQAKCYAQHHDITKHDVDKFLSESNRAGIAKRLLIATTDRIGANARQVCDAQDKPAVRYLLAHFEGANVDYPASMAELPVATRKAKPQPREHQAEAIAAVAAAFATADRGQLIMACGTGKTFTTLWIKERLASASTLVLLPSLGLLAQTLHEWTLAANEPFEVLCVCSDDTVAKRGGDEAVHSVADVAFPVTSATGDIREFLLRPGPKVVFSTYQSSLLIAQVQLDAAVPPFDLAIADEAHRCAGKAGSDFSAVLDARRIRAAKRLFATATPRTYSTSVKKAAGERGTDMVGMDDPAVFGHVAYALPFGEAIRRELLTDYRVVIIGVDNPTIAAWIDNRELLQTASGIETDAESLAAQIGLLKAYKDYDLRRVISFHSRVSRAEQFAQDLVQVAGWVGDEHRPGGTLKTDFVSGAMPTDRRRIKLAQLKALASDERALLANARCLSEGVDVPSLDGVAFIDPRSSQIDIIQAVGRAIRLSASKTAGTIVLPVFIEDGADPVASIEASNFKPIWDVLNALKAHDDVLSAQLDQIRSALGRRPGSAVGPEALSRIQFDLPASVDASFGEALRTYLVERATESWEFGFGALQAYAEEHGDCLVPSLHKLLRKVCTSDRQMCIQ